MSLTHRVGMIVPSSNMTMESEVPRLLRDRERVRPEDRFTFHSARVRMQHVTPEELRAMNAQMERATASCRPRSNRSSDGSARPHRWFHPRAP